MVRQPSAGRVRVGCARPSGLLSRAARTAALQILEALETRLCLSGSVPVFLPAATTAAGNAPTAIVTDDFNQDGNTDLAVTQGNSNSVAVLLGNGDGTLGPLTEFPTGADPTSIATGDFNNDGVDDIVTADAGSGDVSILLGKADSDGNALGTFAAPVNIRVESPGSGPMSVATGDFNGDGNLDIAVAGPRGLYVLAGNGDGSFSAPRLIDRGDFSGVVADSFTPSGNTDLAALDPTGGTVDLFAGDGNGKFAAPVGYSVGVGASSIASGDFNNDGAEDIAVTVPGQNAVEVLLQNTTTVTEPTATQIPIDSVPLIPSGSSGSGSYTYSVGAGTFASPLTIQLDQSPMSLFLADVTGDGNLDIVTANGSANSLTVIAGNGDGTFGAPVDIAVGNDPVAVAVDDLNGDGGEDLVSANAGNGASDTGSASVVLQQSSDVAVAVTASNTYAVYGSDLTFTATVTNNGPGPATDVSFDDYLPGNFTLVSAASSTGTVDTSNVGDINVALGDMASGATATVTIVVQGNQYGDATNSVSAYSDSVDSNYNNDYASIDTPVVGATGAEVALTGNPDDYFYPIVTPLSGVVTSAPVSSAAASSIGILPPIGFGGARVGQDYTYTFTVNNYGPDAATGLNFTDTLPDGVTYVSSSASQGTTDASAPGMVTAALGDLASGASATVSIVIKPTAVGTITNSASVAAADPTTDPYPADNSTTSSTYVYSDSATFPVPVLFEGGNTLATTTKKTAALPTLSIGNVRQANVTSGKTAFVFTVTRSGNLTSASTVQYSTVNGSANGGANFHAVRGTLTFAAGASSAVVTVPVKGTGKYKPDETFVVALSRPGNATLKKSRATGTIVSAVAPPNPFAKGVAINFEPADGPTVKGYLEDTGAVFASRANGFTYGWSSDNTAAAVIRHKVKDARYDTFNVLGAGGASDWQISLPDGRYAIKIVAGDPTNTTNTYQVEANGSPVLNGRARSKQPFVSGTATVKVTDGALILTTGLNAGFDDLDFLNLKYLGG